MGFCVSLISPECISVALNTFVRVCDSGYTSVCVCTCVGPGGGVGFSVPPSVFLSLRTRVTSLLLSLSFSFIPGPDHPTSFFFFLSIPPHQVDPGPREGRPPGLVALSRNPQHPPPAPRHEPPLPKNQAGVEAAQGRGGQEEVRPQSQIAPSPVPPLLPSWRGHIPLPFLTPTAWSSV